MINNKMEYSVNNIMKSKKKSEICKMISTISNVVIQPTDIKLFCAIVLSSIMRGRSNNSVYIVTIPKPSVVIESPYHRLLPATIKDIFYRLNISSDDIKTDYLPVALQNYIQIIGDGIDIFLGDEITVKMNYVKYGIKYMEESMFNIPLIDNNGNFKIVEEIDAPRLRLLASMTNNKYINYIAVTYTYIHQYIKTKIRSNVIDIYVPNCMVDAIKRFGKLLSRDVGDSVIDLYKNLFRKSNVKSSWVIPRIMISGYVHPLEEIISISNRDNHTDIADMVGMLIPHNIDSYNYFLNNISSYYNIYQGECLERGQGISSNKQQECDNKLILHHNRHLKDHVTNMTDLEIIDHFKVYLKYTSRSNLVVRMTSEFTDKHHILVFFSMNPQLPAGAINNENTLMDNYSISRNSYPICIGNLHEFRWYTLEELILSFYIDEKGGRFRRPENTSKVFSRYIINEMVSLVELWPNIKNGKEFLVQIDKIINLSNGVIEDKTLIDEFNKLKGDDRQHVAHILKVLFRAVMYMRLWKGKGYPYPLLAIDTTGTNVHANDMKITRCLSKVEKYIKFLSNDGYKFYMKIPYLSYNNGSYSYHKTMEPLHDAIGDVKRGNKCIREYSMSLAVTTYHYMSILINVHIDGFNIDSISEIS